MQFLIDHSRLLIQACAALMALLLFTGVLPSAPNTWMLLGVLVLLGYVLLPSSAPASASRDVGVIAGSLLAMILISTLTFALVAWQKSAAEATPIALMVGLLAGTVVELVGIIRKRR